MDKKEALEKAKLELETEEMTELKEQIKEYLREIVEAKKVVTKLETGLAKLVE
jgi:hypothetical protein